MAFRTFLFLCCAATLSTIGLINACKDIGSEPPPPPPVITTIIPTADTVGAEVTIMGKHFGSSRGDSYVLFNAVQATNYPEWRDDLIRVRVPGGLSGATTVKVVVGEQQSISVSFQVIIPPATFGVAQDTVSLVVGDSSVQTIFGGTPPYSIISNTDPGVAATAITEGKLKIQALGAGRDTIIIGDSSTPQLKDTVLVTVSTRPLMVSQPIVSMVVGDSVVETISGGTPPYVLVSKGDTTKATVSISGSILTIRAIAAGSSTVIVGDNSTPQLRDTITVSVSSPVSFANQIQPIFTNNCVNAGCHPGNFAPFSMQIGQSYNNLVNVPSTNSPPECGLLRVKPFSADSSVLYRRISGTCSDQMPLGQTPLSSSNQNLIRTWINQGARNN